MDDGILVYINDVWFIKSITQSSHECPEIYYELHPDTLDDFIPSLSDITTWNGKKVRFEVVKKFLANKTQYLAKVIHEKIALSWDDIFLEIGHLEHISIKTQQYMKNKFNPPTKK